jgi:plastocyanin
LVGGDDGDVIINPSVGAPSDPTCGAAATPCSFDGTSVVSSGFMFSSPGSQPSFDVQVNAPVGTYAFLCLLHPGMQETVNVVPPDVPVRSPDDVAVQLKHQVRHAKRVYADRAEAQAEAVSSQHKATGATAWTISAGGFFRNVSADEYVEGGLHVDVGDTVAIEGNFEIHTATVPKRSFKSVPFIITQCEVPGPDTPANSPADCASPADFQSVFNPTALFPTASSELVDPSTFVNSGVFAFGSSFIFDAVDPGVYRVVCLVHGPSMSMKIRVQ